MLPLFTFLVKEVISPEFFSHFFTLDTEFFTIDISELGESESPSEKSRTHSTGTLLWVNLKLLSHSTFFIFIGGNNNVDILNNSQEVLVHFFTINLEFEDGYQFC